MAHLPSLRFLILVNPLNWVRFLAGGILYDHVVALRQGTAVPGGDGGCFQGLGVQALPGRTGTSVAVCARRCSGPSCDVIHPHIVRDTPCGFYFTKAMMRACAFPTYAFLCKPCSIVCKYQCTKIRLGVYNYEHVHLRFIGHVSLV